MARPNRRPRIVGPFFLIALLLSAGIFIWQKQQHTQAMQTVGRPIIEHQVIGGESGSGEVMPRPDLVEDYADDLKLSAAQRQKLAPIIARYRREAAPLKEQLSLEQDRWERVDVEAMGKDRPSGQQISEHLAKYSELSGRLTRLRFAYWPQVEPVLSLWQRHRVSLFWMSELRGQPLPRRPAR
jgi:hypothetical protein